jgi:autotransporter-associated beta strand protein
MDSSITCRLSQAIGVLVNTAGSNTVAGTIIMPNGGGNPYIVVSNGSFLALSGPIVTETGNNPRTLILGGAGNGLLSGAVNDVTLPTASLTKADAGTWTITSTNSAIGTLTVSNGTLVLNGQWTGPATIASTNASTTGTLTGSGLVSNLTVSAGGKFVPGGYGSVGNFTVSNLLSLQGATYISLNKSLAQSNTIVKVMTIGTTNVTATAGSSLVVSNLGPALVAGDAFYVFNQGVTNGDLVSITSGFTLASGLVLSNYLAVDGSIKVVQTINPNPGPIQFAVSGNTLTLSWPTNSGWTLQAQTNTLSVGLSTNSANWFDVPNSSLVTTTNIIMNRTNPAVFYRLRL